MSNEFAPFVVNVDVAQWTIVPPILADTPPPGGAPIRVLKCATRKPTVAEATALAAQSSSPLDIVIGFAPRPPGSGTRYYSTFDGAVCPGQPHTQITLFEIPPGSNQWWICMRSVVVARGFINEHKLCYCCKAWSDLSVEKN